MDEKGNDAIYRVTLEGDERLEDLPLREVAAFLDGIVTLVARGSADILSRPIRAAGRYEGPVEDASRIRLARLASGSVVAELLPAPAKSLPDAINLDAETLSEQAFGLVIDVASGSAAEHPDLARALTEFYDRFAGRRPGAALRLEESRPDREREVVVDAASRDVLRKAADTATVAAMSTRDVTGRLFEANLEAHSAQVRTPTGEKVDVQFGPEHEPDIRRLLGNRAALRGDITYDPKTSRAKAVRIREILTGDQLGLDFAGVDFWTDRAVSELIAEAGVKAVEDPADLELPGVSDEEWEALYEALRVAR
jgi:hypothetical protein